MWTSVSQAVELHHEPGVICHDHVVANLGFDDVMAPGPDVHGVPGLLQDERDRARAHTEHSPDPLGDLMCPS